MNEWRWGDVHRARFEHPLFKTIPVLRTLFSIETPTDGDDFTINRGAFEPYGENAFIHRQGAGLRALYDLADLKKSQFIVATGQSGNPLSAHWDDMTELWRTGETVSFSFGRDDAILRLIPYNGSNPP